VAPASLSVAGSPACGPLEPNTRHAIAKLASAAIENVQRRVMGNLPWQEKPAIVVGLTSGD
jgi:hypothetical protein